MPSSHALVVPEIFGSDDQYVIDDQGVVSKTFSDGKVLSLREYFPRGYVLHLADDNHRLNPVAHFMHTVDEEDRMSVDIRLRLGKMPLSSFWGKASNSVTLRSYESHRPFWRDDHEGSDQFARDKMILHGNLSVCLPKDRRDAFSAWNSFEFRGDMDGSGKIPDDLWKSVQEFALAAAREMQCGEFPDFSLLNRHAIINRRGDAVTFAPLDDVLAYDGPLKDCE